MQALHHTSKLRNRSTPKMGRGELHKTAMTKERHLPFNKEAYRSYRKRRQQKLLGR